LDSNKAFSGRIILVYSSLEIANKRRSK